MKRDDSVLCEMKMVLYSESFVLETKKYYAPPNFQYRERRRKQNQDPPPPIVSVYLAEIHHSGTETKLNANEAERGIERRRDEFVGYIVVRVYSQALENKSNPGRPTDSQKKEKEPLEIYIRMEHMRIVLPEVYMILNGRIFGKDKRNNGSGSNSARRLMADGVLAFYARQAIARGGRDASDSA